MSFFLTGNRTSPDVIEYEDKVDKSKNGNPNIRLLVNIPNAKTIKLEDENSIVVKDFNATYRDIINIAPNKYQIYVDNSPVGEFDFRLGGVYTAMLVKHSKEIVSVIYF